MVSILGEASKNVAKHAELDFRGKDLRTSDMIDPVPYSWCAYVLGWTQRAMSVY